MNDPNQPPTKRSKLVLPTPQISDAEIEQVVKMGKANETIREAVVGSDSKATDKLLSDYNLTPNTTAMRTPAASRDNILMVSFLQLFL